MTFRPLNDQEITALKNQGCKSEDWQSIQVKDPFQPDVFTNVYFSGEVQIGQLTDTVTCAGGITKPCGIYNSHIHNCTISDQVYISNVNLLANYDIEEGVIVENTGQLVVEGESSFGNGTEIEILNEGGGRPLKIFNRLSSQLAYFLVLYRHRSALIEKLETLVDAYVQTKVSSTGVLGKRSRISNCSILTNMIVGPYAEITGAQHLENGTVASCEEAPSTIGHGVIAKDFLQLSGSKIEDASMVTSCFIGQGVKISRQYSAENSGFFANSEGMHGEACSVFAGPYTVTHHKSTLLIGSMFSFYNAGSGTNQSNHMYKLGPVHQGILERGSKTGSFSYLLWPCRVGAFSAVIGKHYANFDTSDLPFSYINEVESKSVLTPAMNFFTVGTCRDSAKWPSRDKRKDPVKLDLINFELFSPYTIGKMLKGIETLKSLYQGASKKQDYINYKGIQIKRLLLKTCTKYYEMGIKIFLGECLIEKLEKVADSSSLKEVQQKLETMTSQELKDWVDISGLLAPKDEIEKVLESVEKGELKSLEDIQNRLKNVYENYKNYEWSWCASLIENRLNTSIKNITTDQLSQIISDWKNTKIKFNNMIHSDALKEFDSNAQIGFGIDGDEEIRKQDFEAVRGKPETNSFIRHLEDENKQIEQIAERMTVLVEKLK